LPNNKTVKQYQSQPFKGYRHRGVISFHRTAAYPKVNVCFYTNEMDPETACTEMEIRLLNKLGGCLNPRIEIWETLFQVEESESISERIFR